MGVDEVVSTVGLWWPAAEEDAVREAAAVWERTAVALDRAGEVGRAGALRARAQWTGAAADGFEQVWRRHEAELGRDAAGCRALAAALRGYADAVADAKREVIALAATAGATLVAGIGLAWVTFGASAAAAAGVSASLVAAAEAVGVALSATAARIIGGALVGAAFGAGEAAVVDMAVTQPLRVEAFGTGGYSPAEAATAAATGGVLGGALGGTLGGVVSGTARPAAGAVDHDLRAIDDVISAALDPAHRGSLGPLFRPGVHDPVSALAPSQVPTARLLADEGASVHPRPDVGALVRSEAADRGRLVDMARPEAPTAEAVENRILESGGRLARHGDGDLVIDGRGGAMSVDAAGDGLAAAVERARAQGLDLPDSIRFVFDDTSIHYP